MPHPLQTEVMQHLRANFHSQCLFFWNHLEGRNIYVVFRPKAMVPQKFSIMKTHHMLPQASSDSAEEAESGSDQLAFNTSEVVAEMMSIGRGLIDQVVYH